MSTHESPRQNFNQSLDEWTPEDVCVYVKNILSSMGEPGVRPGRVTTSWDSDTTSMRITGSAADHEDENIGCTIEVNDYADPDGRIFYIITLQPAEILALDSRHMPIDTDITPGELLCYLATNGAIAKPEINQVSERCFQKFAAHMALEVAAEKGGIKLEHLAHLDVLPFTTDERLQAKHRACEKILEQCVEIDGIDHHYTQSYEYVHAELARALRPISTHITTPKSPDTK